MKAICLMLLLSRGCWVYGQVPSMELPTLREGLDTLWLDSLLLPVEKDLASYFTLTFYHLDQDVWTIKTPWRKRSYLFLPQFDVKGKVGHPVALTGHFEWRNRKGVTVAQEEFNNGFWSGITKIYDKSGVVERTIDYNKKWDNELWSYYVEDFKNGVVKKAAFEKYDAVRFRWQVLCTQGCQISRDFQ